MSRLICLIISEQASADERMQEAIRQARAQGHRVEEWLVKKSEGPARLAAKAAARDFDAIVAVGGDGTLNQVVNGIFHSGKPQVKGVGVIPFGTANDFAKQAQISEDPGEALQIILDADAVPLDLGKVNEHVFINIASCGFPAEITTEASSRMKAIFSKFAYFVTGLTKATSTSAKEGHLVGPDLEWRGRILALSICNGRQAGGGFQVCPGALLDDGLFDILIVPDLPAEELLTLADDLLGLGGQWENEKLTYLRTPWLKVSTADTLQVNLDGEPIHGKSFRFEILPGKIPFFLPSVELIQNETSVP